jgi:hypothetical protein
VEERQKGGEIGRRREREAEGCRNGKRVERAKQKGI